MRQFYKSYKMVRALTQGSIINNCLADSYSKKLNVYGLIITPRCDLAHEGKVSTIHYLPIVEFEDWICCDGEDYLYSRWSSNVKDKFYKACDKYQMPNDLADFSLYEIMAKRLIADKSQLNGFLEKADLFFCSSTRHKAFSDYIHSSKTHDTLLKNLIEDKLPAYYLIEDWEVARAKPKIVLLRELKRISYETGQKISVGMNASEMNRSYDELKYTSINSELYHICAEVNSPFIEHIMQKFTHNFCRIGVDDRDFDSTFSLLSDQIKMI